MTLLLDGLYRTSSKELPKQAQRDDELLSLPLTSCRLHVCLYVGRGRFHQAMLPALGALFSLPIQNAPTTIVSVPVKAGAGYERSLILRTDRTLGTTTPQSPTMSIGLLRLEIMHISRIRQLWLRRRVATLSIPLSCAQRVAKSATTNPTAAALAVHGRACAAREASTRTTMGTKHATGIPPWQKDTSSASTSSCASAQAAML